ncbi:hypothetical protein C8R44DRAFT_750305 [Mycena epipterygia]|nr:hypothetical protein C8R44DRAFT_750305 [Mycena epipterygia]
MYHVYTEFSDYHGVARATASADCGMLIPIEGQKSKPGAGRAGGETDVQGMGQADAWWMGEEDVWGCGVVFVFGPKVSTSAQLNTHTAQVARYNDVPACLPAQLPAQLTFVIQLQLTRIEENENKKIKVMFFYSMNFAYIQYLKITKEVERG